MISLHVGVLCKRRLRRAQCDAVCERVVREIAGARGRRGESDANGGLKRASRLSHDGGTGCPPGISIGNVRLAMSALGH